jgi:DNA-binding NarL/FixJ family response regulator
VTRVFLVDDKALVRAGLRMVIDSQPDMTVIGEAEDGREALEQLAVSTADVVLMDVRMPRLDGVEATRVLLERDGAAGPRVIVLTTFDLDEDSRLAALSERERAILLEVARGQSNAEIAAALHIAEATVKTYLGRLRAKLDVRDRVQLVIYAYDTGLVAAALVVPRAYRRSRPRADKLALRRP